MTTLIKKDQIATDEFIKNPLPEDPWDSTSDTASLAAIAAKIAAISEGLPDVLIGACEADTQHRNMIYIYGNTTLSEIISARGLCILQLVFVNSITSSEILYEYEAGSYIAYSLFANGAAVSDGDIQAGDRCLIYCEGLDLFLLSNDRWRNDIKGKQEKLESGITIKTLHGNSLLGGGDIELGDTLCYCISNTGASTSSVVAVDVTHPSGFSPRNGSMLLAHFNTDVPAAASLSVIGTTLTNLYLVYHQIGITTGVLKAGDKALIYCINSVAHVVAIDRQGGGSSTLAALTDTAVSPPYAWQGLVYNPALSKWTNGGIQPAYRSYEHAVTANTGTLQLVCAADESAHHTVTVDPSLTVGPSITINLQNYNDNRIIIMQGQGVTYYPLTVLINGVQTGLAIRYGTGLGIMDNSGSTIIYTKSRSVIITIRAVDATTPYVLTECFEIEATPIT